MPPVGLPGPAGSAGQIVISWLQRTDGSVTCTVQESPDLSPGSWGVSSATVQAGNPSPAAPTGYERKQITVPATENMRFFRIAAAFMP